ncbi:FAD/NAD(P)-binding domain-containing protein, partial [Serendipita vermifera]
MKIAVVGSGCSGLAATWALNEYSDHEVHLYEADKRPGGHANTVKFTSPHTGESCMVDMGFIVFNPPTYPNFLRFLKLSNVAVHPTTMSFAVTRDDGAFEWGGENLFTVFCQPQNLFKGTFWRMIWDVLRFNASARRLLVELEKRGNECNGVDEKGREDIDVLSVGEYLKQNGYSDSFRDDYLMPMATSIWSTPPSECERGFSARSILRFMHNHHLLQITGKPKWLTIAGGSIQYVKKIIARMPRGTFRHSTPVHSVTSIPHPTEPGKHKILLRTSTGHVEEYDHVIMACHSTTTLEILKRGDNSSGGGVREEEKKILGGFKWTRNPTVLHSDVSALPRNEKAWCAWNYVTRSEPPSVKGPGRANSDEFALSYLMNTVQRLDMDKLGPVICTLNPTISIKEELIQARGEFEHPMFNAEAERCQKLMPTIQNTRGISYAGAWMGYGFHEDGFTSGLKAAVNLGGVTLPFEILPADRRVESVWMADVFDVLEKVRVWMAVVVYWIL